MSDASKTAENKPAHKADLEEQATGLAPKIKIDSDTGILTLEEGAFAAALPEGTTVESLLRDQKAVDLFGGALKLAAVREATKAMAANKKLEQVTFKVPTFGDNAFEGVLRRTAEQRVVGSNDVKKVQGVISVFKHEVVGTRTKAESDKIKAEFRSLAEAAGL